jgi:hypothetical protein
MGHLDQDSAVGTDEALDGEVGAVGVVRFRQGGPAIGIGVAEGNLAGSEKPLPSSRRMTSRPITSKSHIHKFSVRFFVPTGSNFFVIFL